MTSHLSSCIHLFLNSDHQLKYHYIPYLPATLVLIYIFFLIVTSNLDTHIHLFLLLTDHLSTCIHPFLIVISHLSNRIRLFLTVINHLSTRNIPISNKRTGKAEKYLIHTTYCLKMIANNKYIFN